MAVVAILGGLIFGAISGYVTTRLYVPSFVSTLAIGFVALAALALLRGAGLPSLATLGSIPWWALLPCWHHGC